MARTARNIGLEPLRILGVVKNQQPPAVRLPARQRLHDRAGGVGSGRDVQAESGAELRQREFDFGDLLGGDPPNHVVGRAESVRVLDRDLGLPDTAHALQRDRTGPGQHHRGTVAAKIVPGGCEGRPRVR